MIFTNDIFRFIGDSLSADGYKDIREVPIKVVEEKINEFLRMKLSESNKELDNSALLMRLQSFLEGQPNKDQMMANFTFYLLWYMSMLQDFEIIWRIEEVDSPKFLESEFAPGKLDSLVTNKNINYISTFNFAFDKARELKNNESRGR